jgi:L-ascorbate metabolism protein UlaG (beta-lactamase superfamily)
MIIFSVILAVFLMTFFGIGYFISAPRYKGPSSDHFNGKKFTNPTGIAGKGFGEAMEWMLTRKPGVWHERKDIPYGNKPVDRVTEGVRITFVNHSTFLIQTNGLNILTDPVWSKRTSPVEWAGPKRMRPPGIRLEDLPHIDLLLLSHNHWDHLDIETVSRIYRDHHPKIITPLGVDSFLQRNGIRGSGDLDWWQELSVAENMTVRCVPAQHFSGRGMFDRDATLWCGYVLLRSEGNIYFVGDTGYNETTFNQIGIRCAPISVALVPIGAYKPASFMAPIHCSPEEAVKIHRECGAKISIATHFGTFPLADDGEREPIVELDSALKRGGIDPASFVVLKEGMGYNF